MAKLIQSFEGVIVREFNLEYEKIIIGRKADCHIQIDDATISGHHSVVSMFKNFYLDTIQDVYVEDLDSTNGTYINGKKIKKHMLRHGDLIQVGRHEFKFIDQDAPDFDKTVIMQPLEAARTTAMGDQKNLKAAMKILTGSKTGNVLELIKAFTTIGNSGITVVISKRRQGYFISNIAGNSKSTGLVPLVNSIPLGVQSVPLQNQDEIELGTMKLEFIIQ